MPVVTPADAETFALHGATFTSYVSRARGSSTLCAWQLQVAAGTPGTPHRPDHEEVLLVQAGELQVDLDGERLVARAGDVVVVPVGARLSVGTDTGATAWVTTTAGLRATTDDGAEIAPPWAQ